MNKEKVLQDITEIVNKKRKYKSCWMYISVEVEHATVIGKEKGLEVRLIYFDKNGKVTRISAIESRLHTNSKDELVRWMKKVAIQVAVLPKIPWIYFRKLLFEPKEFVKKSYSRNTKL